MKVSIVATIAVFCLISVGTPIEGRSLDAAEQISCDIVIRLYTGLINWRYYPGRLCSAFVETDDLCNSNLVELCRTKKGVTTTSVPELEPDVEPEVEPEAE